MNKPMPVAWMVHSAPDSEGNDIPYTNWSAVKILMDAGYKVTPLYALDMSGLFSLPTRWESHTAYQSKDCYRCAHELRAFLQGGIP